MNRVISWLQSFLWRVVFTAFIVGMAFFSNSAFGYDNHLQAQAKAMTPEARAYQVEDKDEYAGKDIVDSVKQKVEDTADNVREKLNLDEPIPPSTQKFLDQVQDNVDDVVEPVTGNPADSRF